MTDDLPDTLLEAARYFADLDICEAYMRKIKWPDGKITCPACGSKRIGEVKTRRLIRCLDCRKQNSLREQRMARISPRRRKILYEFRQKHGVRTYSAHRL